MDAGSELIFLRMQLHELIEENPDWSNYRLAYELGKSESWVRKWRERFKMTSHESFEMYMSQSRAPKTVWRESSQEVKKVVAQLRVELSEQYHRKAGAKLILHELRKREDLKDAGHYVPNSDRTISKILDELGYIYRPQKYERVPLILPEPNEEWEMDFGEIRLDEETIFEFFLVVDKGTSRVIYIEGCEGYNAETALEAVARLLTICGLPKRLRLDRDSRFVGSWTRDSYPSALIRFLRVLGVEPVVCPPRRPDKKPVVERCVFTVKHEWLDRFSLETIADVYDILPDFIFYHNAERVHFGRACQGKTPDEAFPELPALPHLPEKLQPNSWLKDYHGRVFRRRVSSNGTIQIDKYTYYVDKDLAKQRVLVHLDAKQQVFFISCAEKIVKQLDIRGLIAEELDFGTYLIVMKQEARTIDWLHGVKQAKLLELSSIKGTFAAR